MKYVLVYCPAGDLQMTIDEKEFNLTASQVITITSGQVHPINKSPRSKGFILDFTLDFFCKDDKDIELIFHNGLFCHFAMNEVIDVDQSIVVPLLLRTTEIKLNELAKLHAGKTAQSVICGLVASEAKRLLTYGDFSVKEVACQLAFNDPFYFSNFFKKQTKLSPKAYKEKFAL